MPQPVLILLRQTLMLRSAIAECLDHAKPKPVHLLRSTTRRIEATLELLALCSGIDALKRSTRSLRRSLGKIRRAAGEVRDCDVHRDLLRDYTPARKTAALDAELASARHKAADKLRVRLKKDHRKLERALDDLEIVLKPALDLNLSGGQLADIAQRWFEGKARDLDPGQDDGLHAMRKACKTARYLAEPGVESAKAAAKTAARFEASQEALGAWHDHLLLLDEARASLPKHNKLIDAILADTDRLRERADAMARSLVARS
ncbi:MAG: CHAD domain-containing protein [Acidobacteriota bacterium]|nr:CHAD domain-containing protein [Acidobacteriota bacterium]